MDISASLSINDSGAEKDNGLGNLSPVIGGLNLVKRLKVLHVTEIPIVANYGSIYDTFKLHGTVSEIRMKFDDSLEMWEAWICFRIHEEASKACTQIDKMLMFGNKIKGALCEKVPMGLDIFKPDNSKDTTRGSLNTLPNQRKTKPPTWITVTAEEGEVNYFKVLNFLKSQVGSLKPGDVSKFGRNCVLVHAR